jgi:uncharacterized integral membrane protein (TIGR00698 family)
MHISNSRQLALPNKTYMLGYGGGLAFTFLIAGIGMFVAKAPGFDHIGQMACAIGFAVIFRQIWGYPEKLRPGIQFASKKLLRLAIVLFGLKLNILLIVQQGLGLLLRDVGMAILSILLTLLLAKWLKADASLSMLLGIGTGICGAAAIAAVSPILRAKEEDTAMGAGLIALIGTVFAVGYTLLRPLLPLTNMQYGVWSGTSLHEIAHVALAAAPAGQEGLAVALLAKLGRVMLLVPLSFILLYFMKRTGKVQTATAIEFPRFLIGFIAMSFLGSYVSAHPSPITDTLLHTVTPLTSFILTTAMVGLGLHVNLRAMRDKAFRPLLAMTLTSILLSLLTYLTV